MLLGLFSVGIFAEKKGVKIWIKNILFLSVVAYPILAIFITPSPIVMQTLSICYFCFYSLIFIEVLQFLIKPSYINADIVSASACGYLLLIEIGIFVMQSIYYEFPDSFKGINTNSFTETYLDIVYFCSITVTSIGYGDITPSNHITKLIASILGIAGQFYSVVLVGILISKYTSAQHKER